MKTDYFSMLIEKLDNITNLQNAKLLSLIRVKLKQNK